MKPDHRRIEWVTCKKDSSGSRRQILSWLEVERKAQIIKRSRSHIQKSRAQLLSRAMSDVELEAEEACAKRKT
jgi:hypothetical protein